MMARDDKDGLLSRRFGRKRSEEKRYEQASRRARRNLSAVMAHEEEAMRRPERVIAHQEWVMRKRDRLIDLAAIERQLDDRAEPLFPPESGS